MSRKLLPFFKRAMNKNLFFFAVGILAVFIGRRVIEYTSTDHFCDLCHAHPHVTESWKASTHYVNKSGIVVHCVECHLPPEGWSYVTEKARLGIKDLYGTVFKDVSKIDWETKGKVVYARSFTYDESCVRCHAELFSLDLSEKGVDAHVYYFHKKGEVLCINCHLSVGHYSEEAIVEVDLTTPKPEPRKTTLSPKPESPEVFIDYAQSIPGSDVVFEMIAIPGGTFLMGSSDSESYRREDEGPARKVRVSPFWMGRTEVSWDEWEIYYRENVTSGKYASIENNPNIDVVTGPTPPYGAPDQGWGRGSRPAITMTHHAAMKYCEWLSLVTGDKYRLPTEAEWEYACRGATTTPCFFEGDPSKFTRKRWVNRIFGVDTTVINQYVWYALNGKGKTNPAYSKKSNPFGLLHMLGNVREFCLDWYSPDAYAQMGPEDLPVDPRGPGTGRGHVIRGGSFQSDGADLRSAARDHTRHDSWLLSDPQSPKSIWWYSDCYDVGFRVVSEYKGKQSFMNNN